MASDKQAQPIQATADQLERYAFHLFSARSAGPFRRSSETLAVESYRDAKAFMEVASRVRSGEETTEKPTGPQLSEVCCPNMPKRHPHNLVSQFFAAENGGVPVVFNRVKSILAKLEANPTLGKADEDTFSGVDGFDVSWGKQEINIARTIFPAYCKA